jgi:cell division protein ZapE
MTPRQRYKLDLERGDIFADPSQAAAIEDLQVVYNNLNQLWSQAPGLWEAFVKKLANSKQEPGSGLYLWGGVGRGKTYLMDLFFQCLPSERKMRMHFHRFMQMVHRGLHEQRGQKNPLNRVAENISNKIDVICFDEFFVSDIGDAMILANLLEALMDAGITLVATSNIPPESLYENGLQREKFLPAIALIQKHTKVLNMDGIVDYRLRRLEQAEIFHTPLDKQTEQAMLTCFQELSAGLEIRQDYSMEILGRDIRTKFWAEGIAWFDFDELCVGPRSTADYIEIAQLFHTVLLSNIPVLDMSSENAARRFISLIDEFYDHNLKLIFSAAAPLDQLYQGSELHFPFERTLSRLLEMQSHDYLALEHNP